MTQQLCGEISFLSTVYKCSYSVTYWRDLLCRTCDRLRCTDCDFNVLSFDDVHWASNTDYLFLRNNMPDYQRLKSKLKTKKGAFDFLTDDYFSVNSIRIKFLFFISLL